jgi:hypothetical protein
MEQWNSGIMGSASGSERKLQSWIKVPPPTGIDDKIKMAIILIVIPAKAGIQINCKIRLFTKSSYLIL